MTCPSILDFKKETRKAVGSFFIYDRRGERKKSLEH